MENKDAFEFKLDDAHDALIELIELDATPEYKLLDAHEAEILKAGMGAHEELRELDAHEDVNA